LKSSSTAELDYVVTLLAQKDKVVLIAVHKVHEGLCDDKRLQQSIVAKVSIDIDCLIGPKSQWTPKNLLFATSATKLLGWTNRQCCDGFHLLLLFEISCFLHRYLAEWINVHLYPR
jgi:hypothetical protein